MGGATSMSSRSERGRTPPEGGQHGGNKCRITRTVERDACGDADTHAARDPSGRCDVQLTTPLKTELELSMTPRRGNRRRQADDFPRSGVRGDDDTIKPVKSAQTQAIPLKAGSRAPTH